MKLLDLFCGAGGAGEGYRRAGFEVTGVDIRHQPRYLPGMFIQSDALAFLEEGGAEWFDAIHASPPCQKWSIGQNAAKNADAHEDLVTPLRPLLEETGLPYVIENVPGSPLVDPARVCMARALRHDGYELRRHRLFETNWQLRPPRCECGGLPAAPVFGHSAGRDWRRKHGRDFGADAKRAIMGTYWMNRDETSEAIPPMFTEFIGHQLLQHLSARRPLEEAV